MNIVLSYRSINHQLSRVYIAIFIVYLFHLSALIGIGLGHFDWFVKKTPLNLSLMCVLTYWVMKPSIPKHHLVLSLIFLLGMIVEILGVKYSLFFGEYSYGENLGFKLMGVPLLIGMNWTLLTWVTAAISARFFNNIILQIITGSALMLLLDLFMEPSAPLMGFWTFSAGVAPISNYLAWFVIAGIMHLLVQKSQIKADFNFSLHYFIIQLIFFGGILLIS